MSDRYLEDEPEDEKVFMLSGDWSDKDDKCKVYKDVVSLGGRFVESDVWNSSCTHVIAKSYDMTEKMMGAMAAGRWVITKRFVEKSVKNEGWVKARAYVIDDAVLHHRRRWFVQGCPGAAFYNMKVVFILDKDQDMKKEVYTRIVRAGDGAVLENISLETLVSGSIGMDEITHIVVDPSILEDHHPKAKLFKEWMEIVEGKNLEKGKLWHVYYRFFTDRLQRPGITGTEEKFSIFNPNVQMQAKRAVEAEALYGNRVRDAKELAQIKKFKELGDNLDGVLKLTLQGHGAMRDGKEYDEDTPASIDDLIDDIDELIGKNDSSEISDKESSIDMDISSSENKADHNDEKEALDQIEMFLGETTSKNENKSIPKSSSKKSRKDNPKSKSKNADGDKLKEITQQPYTKKRIRQSLKGINFDEDSDEDAEWKDSKDSKKRKSRRKSSNEDDDVASLPLKTLPSRSTRRSSSNLKDINYGED